jgi:hypothetical protein
MGLVVRHVTQHAITKSGSRHRGFGKRDRGIADELQMGSGGGASDRKGDTASLQITFSPIGHRGGWGNAALPGRGVSSFRGLAMGLQVEIALARIAPKVVSFPRITTDRPETRGEFVVDPATGALKVAPTHRDEAPKAFQGVLTGAKAGLYFTLGRLYCRKFALQVGNVCLRFNSQCRGDFDKVL